MVGIEKGYKWILGYCLFQIILLALETACMVAGYESINFITMAIVCLSNTAFTVGYCLAVNKSAGNRIMLKIWGVCVIFPMWFSPLYQFFLIMRISKTGEGGYANIILPAVFVIHVSVVIVGAFLTAIMLHKICFWVFGGSQRSRRMHSCIAECIHCKNIFLERNIF